eukprot:CAMPEP_0117084662 /NCGR_PEP_ID=MMETSP0472-20121206/59579_1 /TAXON_ID=693140 ORGANISM="Tiarina fusus, Strain LIS" /NCGR_SAMPLE_ID=MMETSP0472 /ASSEMBLY_ACC=CAM_ASM_000603 /LENGTH=87 /DNA_ID=CAMNT_0004813729 /DNA_START=18 /DNA_END=277 /DNA_ORIENTATION=-
MTFAVSVEEFYGETVVANIAELLSIPASRIKVVDVQAGSTNAVVEILDEQETSDNTRETVSQVKRLVDVAVTIKRKLEANEFDVGLP